MNERHTDSSGLPLRAMVMVLLFLGVVFLLVGFQAMGSGDDSSADDSPVAVSTTSTPSPRPEPPAPAAKAEVRVYNISEASGSPRTPPISFGMPAGTSPRPVTSRSTA